LPAKGDVVLGCLLGFLLEGIEHIDGLLKLGDREHTVCLVGLKAKFIGPWPNDGHRLRIGRLVSALDGAQLKASSSSGFCWKLTKVIPRRSGPNERLVRPPDHARSGIGGFSGVVKLHCGKGNKIDSSGAG